MGVIYLINIFIIVIIEIRGVIIGDFDNAIFSNDTAH